MGEGCVVLSMQPEVYLPCQDFERTAYKLLRTQLLSSQMLIIYMAQSFPYQEGNNHRKQYVTSCVISAGNSSQHKTNLTYMYCILHVQVYEYVPKVLEQRS